MTEACLLTLCTHLGVRFRRCAYMNETRKAQTDRQTDRVPVRSRPTFDHYTRLASAHRDVPTPIVPLGGGMSSSVSCWDLGQYLGLQLECLY